MSQLLSILSPGLMNPYPPVPSAYFLISRPCLPCVGVRGNMLTSCLQTVRLYRTRTLPWVGWFKREAFTGPGRMKCPEHPPHAYGPTGSSASLLMPGSDLAHTVSPFSLSWERSDAMGIDSYGLWSCRTYPCPGCYSWKWHLEHRSFVR